MNVFSVSFNGATAARALTVAGDPLMLSLKVDVERVT